MIARSRSFHQWQPPRRILSPLPMRLITWLERSNYVPFEGAWRIDYPHTAVIEVLRDACMTLYHEERNIWVPDVGTYDWMVRQKYGAHRVA